MSLENEGNDPRIQLEKVDKMTDEQELLAVVCSSDSPRVRLVALSKIDDDQTLLKVVKEAAELDARLVAVERISSQEMIADIVKAPENLDLMGMCFSRITERSIIESIADDPESNPVARRMAVEHFADEAYLAEVYEAKTGRKSERAVEALIDYHGGGLRGVRAIGRFRRSEKALKALGTIALKGGDTGGLAVEYLCKALDSANPKLAKVASDELAVLTDPELVSTLIHSMDDPKRGALIREVLKRIDTLEARSALGIGN
jgi:hypothetical protein